MLFNSHTMCVIIMLWRASFLQAIVTSWQAKSTLLPCKYKETTFDLNSLWHTRPARDVSHPLLSLVEHFSPQRRFNWGIRKKSQVMLSLDRKQLNCAGSWAQSRREARRGQESGGFAPGFYYARFGPQLPPQPIGLMVKRKKTSPTTEEHENG